MIEIANVSKVYESRGSHVHALDDVSLHVAEGEFLSLLGPSGCGKSTLLMLLAGLIPRNEGTIRIGGTVVESPYTNLGIVFQRDLLLEWKNVLDNVLVQAAFRGLPAAQHRQKAMDLLEQVGLKGFEKKHPWQLSGGMRQRVGICRALLLNPPLLLMDEPFGAVDALTREQLNLDLQRIWHRNSNMIIVFVTHSIAEAVFLSDRIAVMSPRPGKIVEEVNIDLPRPRRLDTRATREFDHYVQVIRSHFREMGLFKEE